MMTNSEGFTLPELIIVMTVTTVLMGVIMLFTFSYWQYSYVSQTNQETFTDRLNAGDYLRDSIGNGSGIITQTSITDAHPSNPDPSNTSYWIPVHAIPATVNYGSSSTTPVLYYKRYSKDASGQILFNGSQPYEDELVVYIEKSSQSLKIRTLANPSATNNKAKTSCAPAYASASCPEDKVLAKDITSIEKRFFSRSGVIIDWTSSYDSTTNQYTGPDNPTVEVAELTINIAKKAVFQKSKTITNSTVIRIALRNT